VIFFFFPLINEIYSNGNQLNKTYQLDFIENILEGNSRTGHFQGVCQVVEKLLNIVRPNFLFLGQKDYQQCLVITKLIELMDWVEKLKIIIVPTIRESSGLAMSSRNMRLSEPEKKTATLIYQSLLSIKNQFNNIDFNILTESIKQKLLESGFEKVDYVTICNAKTLEPVSVFEKEIKLVALIAAFLKGVRLIDNLLLTE
jgi:pantoate--beta-alanine ligase